MDDPDKIRDPMTVSQAAEYLQISEESVRELCRKGRLRHSRTAVRGVGKSSIRIRRRWIDDYLDGNATGGAAPKPRIGRAAKTAAQTA